MIEYVLRAITADELSFHVNRVQNPPSGEIKLQPAFTRTIRAAGEAEKGLYFVFLECKIAGTEEAPTPFDVLARFVGVFEVKNMVTPEDRRTFAINATETVFPYLRAAITNLTADALIKPITLPVTSGAVLFPEDRAEQYTVTFDPKTLN